MTLSIYSITIVGVLIHPIRIFLHQKNGIPRTAFCGLCPHPASGIRLGFSGNTLNADGIRLGRLSVKVSRPGFFFFINIQSAFPHIIRSTGSAPDPNHGISVSIFS